MKRYYRLLTLIFAFAALPCKADEWIRINQLGYLPQSIKVAVFMSETKPTYKNTHWSMLLPEKRYALLLRPKPPANQAA